MAEEDLEGLQDVERDSHGHLRLAEVDFGNILKAKVQERLQQLKIKMTIASKNIGYELRCADPIPMDMEYTRDLGYCAAKYHARRRQRRDGLHAGRPLHPGAVRGADRPGHRQVRRSASSTSSSTRYAIARRYMIRLRRDDFDNPDKLARLAKSANLSPEEFRREFESVVANEPPPLAIDDHGETRSRLRRTTPNSNSQPPRHCANGAKLSERIAPLVRIGRALGVGSWQLEVDLAPPA